MVKQFLQLLILYSWIKKNFALLNFMNSRISKVMKDMNEKRMFGVVARSLKYHIPYQTAAYATIMLQTCSIVAA